ncbi:hypothetical protein BaRGS_00039580, partial [Batillaria attramentaria]
PTLLKDFFILLSSGSELQAPANQGDNITVRCDYEEGNPPIVPKIVHRHGTKTSPFTFHNVDCDDAGELRCEAPGAPENLTATLLVNCPPTFVTGQNQSIGTDDNNSIINFAIRTHTTKMKDCSLIRLDSKKTVNCNSSINVTGTPPDLMLTLLLDNMTTHSWGQWQLNVTNDVGSNVAGFSVLADEDPSSVTTAHITPIGERGKAITDRPQTELTFHTILVIGVGAVVTIVIVVVIVIIIRVIRKRNTGDKRRCLATQRAAVYVDNRHPNEQDMINQANDGSADRLIIAEGHQHGACGRSASASPKAGLSGACEPEETHDVRGQGDGTETYVNVAPTKKMTAQEKAFGNMEGAAAPSCSFESNDYVAVKEIQKRKRQAESDRFAAKTASNALDEDREEGREENDGDGEGLTYVQLDFSGKKARNVTIQPLPRTDYAEVNFKAVPPSSPDDPNE